MAHQPMSAPRGCGARIDASALASRRSTSGVLTAALELPPTPGRASRAGLSSGASSELLARRSYCRQGGVPGPPGNRLHVRAGPQGAASCSIRRTSPEDAPREQDGYRYNILSESCQGRCRQVPRLCGPHPEEPAQHGVWKGEGESLKNIGATGLSVETRSLRIAPQDEAFDG